MKETLRTMISDGLPVLATCAGLILLAEHIGEKEAPHLGTMPVTVRRNAYGRQLSSFMTTAAIQEIGDYPMVFIRAPYITDIHNNHVEILSVVDGHIVAAQYENQIGLAFHPEMTDDIRLHQHFINLVKSRKSCISELDFIP